MSKMDTHASAPRYQQARRAKHAAIERAEKAEAKRGPHSAPARLLEAIDGALETYSVRGRPMGGQALRKAMEALAVTRADFE